MSDSDTVPTLGLMQRLQFSGWLTFLIPFVPMTLFFVIGAGLAALGLRGFGLGVMAVGLIFALIGVFDILVARLGLITLSEPAPRAIDGDIFKVMAARHSTRAYQRAPLSEAHHALVADRLAFHTAPDSACAMAQGRMRAVLLDAKLRVWPGYGAQHFIAVLGPKTYDRLAIIEAGRAVQHVVNEATAAGISTGWIGPGADRSSVEDALGAAFDPARDHVLAVVSLGYAARYKPFFMRLAGMAGKRRKPLADLVFDEAPDLPASLAKAPYKALRPALIAARRAPSSYNAQTSRVILHAADGALVKVQFCCEEGSDYFAPLGLGIFCANWEAGMDALGTPGRWVLLEAPRPIACGLIHDVTWRPLPATA